MTASEARDRLEWLYEEGHTLSAETKKALEMAITALEENSKLKAMAKPLRGYEYHYDHTDCIWYRTGERSKCPVTCSQYRDGWNDAMNYIFRDGKGYMPYRRDKQYGE